MIIPIGGQLPNVPDPTEVAKAAAEAAKAMAKGGVDIGADIAAGVEQILFNTIEGGLRSLESGASDIVNLVQADVATGRTTFDKVRRDVDQACNSVLSQVDRGLGQEIVRKFKSEVERLLRQY